MKNKSLKKIYNKIYAKGERKHYSSILFSGDRVPLAKREVLKEINWRGKNVLDAGCGTGEIAFLIAKDGAKKVLGIDYSKEAILEAKKLHSRPNLSYECADLRKIKGKFDIIVSLGTLEHLDDPFSALKNLRAKLNPGGHLIITCPNWTNPRGYILMALLYLYRAKMILDFKKRLPKVVKSNKKKIEEFIVWLEKSAIALEKNTKSSGAVGLYHFRK